MNEGVFHRSKRATLFSSERSRPAAEGPRDASCGKPPGSAPGLPLGLLINTYHNNTILILNLTRIIVIVKTGGYTGEEKEH